LPGGAGLVSAEAEAAAGCCPAEGGQIDGEFLDSDQDQDGGLGWPDRGRVPAGPPAGPDRAGHPGQPGRRRPPVPPDGFAELYPGRDGLADGPTDPEGPTVTAPDVDQDPGQVGQLSPAVLDHLDGQLATRRAQREAERKRAAAAGEPCSRCGAVESWERPGVGGWAGGDAHGAVCWSCDRDRGRPLGRRP